MHCQRADARAARVAEAGHNDLAAIVGGGNPPTVGQADSRDGKARKPPLDIRSRPEFGFSGLKAGGRSCLCTPRWQEAREAGKAPRVVLRATHECALEWCALEDLKR
ncbi:MAG: DUF2237 family protein, partial [Acetobacteraceae bacterium]